MQIVLLGLLSLIGVAPQADFDGVGLGQAGLAAGMRIVAIGAIARCSRMLHLRAFNLLGFFVVAGDAQRLRVGLRKHDLAILSRGMAGVARLVRERRMQELSHQLGCG